MRLSLSTRALHDALVRVYQALYAGEKDLVLALAVEEDASPAALAEFLRLVRVGAGVGAGAGAGAGAGESGAGAEAESGASVRLEITDEAGLFR